MRPKNESVNNKTPNNWSFGERIVSERKRLNISPTDLRLRTGVGKSTQFRYEAGEGSPDIHYLEILDSMGFDVLYIITGGRSYAAMSAEHQNLIEAYEDASEELRRAAFGVLVSPYVANIEMSRTIPGYYRYEIKGDEDVRFEKHSENQRQQDGDKGDESK